jgi:hypothetical protein
MRIYRGLVRPLGGVVPPEHACEPREDACEAREDACEASEPCSPHPCHSTRRMRSPLHARGLRYCMLSYCNTHAKLLQHAC